MVTYKEPAQEAPCKRACPAGVDIPRYIRLTREGKFDEVLAVIRERIPFPSICGYVCLRPCEVQCRLSEEGKSIAINALKRFVAEKAGFQPRPAAEATHKRIAIIGSGPAGITASYYLAKLGHSVTIFEASPEPGGMMRIGIPEYRMPREVLNAEIDMIRSLEIDIKTSTRIDLVDSLLEDGYDAIFVAIGAHKSMKLGIEGEDSLGVLDSLSFLRDVNSGKRVKIGQEVAVIGGGDTAVEVARTALRLGAERVIIVYRRTWAEMPATKEGIEEALHEGADILFLATPIRITKENEKLRVECVRMKMGKTDVAGRRLPQPITGSEFSMNFDTVITAIGEIPEIPSRFGLYTGKDNTIVVEPSTLATSMPGVFAGGDAVTGPSSIIESIAGGRKAAISIDKYLGGKGVIEEAPTPPEEEVTVPMQGFPIGDRVEIPTLPIRERLKGFERVELGLSEEMAIAEAQRCLICDLPIIIDTANCVGCFTCALRCSFRSEKAFNLAKSAIKVVPHLEQDNEISFTEGCDDCGICARHCPYNALTRGKKKEGV